MKKVTDKKERIYMGDLTEGTTAIKTSNMAFQVPCLKDLPKKIVHTELKVRD